MQYELPLTWLGWKQLVLTVLASLVTGGGIHHLVTTWLTRHKPAAETTEIKIRARVTEGDAVTRWMVRLEDAQRNFDRARADAQLTIDRLRAERDGWQEQYDEVFGQKVVLIHQNVRLLDENKGYEQQIKRMARTLADEGLNYDGSQDTPVS